VLEPHPFEPPQLCDPQSRDDEVCTVIELVTMIVVSEIEDEVVRVLELG